MFSIWVALLMLLNMGIAMTAEYTAVGDLFQLVIGTERVPIVVIIGVVSMLYTAYGGLYVSIITDQWQVETHPLYLTCCSFRISDESSGGYPRRLWLWLLTSARTLQTEPERALHAAEPDVFG